MSFRTSVAFASGSSTGVCATYSDSAEIGVMLRSSSAFCSWPNSVKPERITSDGSPLSLDALAHLFEPVIDQIELERFLVDAGRIQAKDSHPLEKEPDAAVGPEVPAPPAEGRAHVGHRPRGC